MTTKKTRTAFFSSVRTESELKKQVQATLQELGLTWGTFVNNAAKKLITEKKVTFEIRDAAGFTPKKAQEMKDAIAEATTTKKQRPLTVQQAQKHLRELK